MDLIKLLSADEIVAQVLSFLVLFLLMRIFFWKRFLGLLDARKQRIASELKKIDDAKAEVAQMNIEYQAKLAAIEELAQKRIQEAVADGRKITDEVRKKAHEEAQDIINNAKDNIRYEIGKAKEELKENVVDLTVVATEALIREKLTGEDDKRLVREFLDRMDQL
ncbi:MAG: F0F1 ATP synthase subunit B [Candidatus Omnitrophica bacterium]|nr:F0F1 ATP synthase subunit B [Candidatus Omnitrophota bacterium]MBU1870075.1 F0F1 ATP synthase subunit B [Candidatus Omnitrophota bacterium]